MKLVRPAQVTLLLICLSVSLMVGVIGIAGEGQSEPAAPSSPRIPGSASETDVVAVGTGPQKSLVVSSFGNTFLALGSPETSGLDTWPGRFDAEVVAFDIDGDGRDELVGHSKDRFVYVFDSLSGRVLARLETTYPIPWFVDSVLNAVAIGRLGPEESPTIVVANHAAVISGFRFIPSQSSSSDFAFDKVWERRLSDCFAHSGMDARVALADVNADGALEIFAQTEEVGLYALKQDGTLLWKQCWSGGNSAPVIDDLEGDGKLEAIFGSDSGRLSVLDAWTGAPRWTFSAQERPYGITPASIVVSPTVVDLDGKAPKEVLFIARHAPSSDSALFGSYHMAIFAVRADLYTGKPEVVWMRQPGWAHPLSDTPIVAADVDQDGAIDLFGMDWNTIGHKPGNWEPLGPAHVFRLDANGQDVWVQSVDAWWSNKRIVLMNIDEDGRVELLANGAREAHDGIIRMNLDTGETTGFSSVAPWKMTRGPVPFEVDSQGPARVAFPVVLDAGPPDSGAILVQYLHETTFVQGDYSR